MAVPLKNELCTPILASIVQNRLAGLMIAGAVGLQAGLVSLGLPGWPCPFFHTVGLPCPGCGLSRSIIALVQGDWRTSLTLHAFAPLFILALVLVVWATILPQKQRIWLIDQLEIVERRTGITAIEAQRDFWIASTDLDTAVVGGGVTDSFGDGSGTRLAGPAESSSH
jgi:hypothetical protein